MSAEIYEVELNSVRYLLVSVGLCVRKFSFAKFGLGLYKEILLLSEAVKLILHSVLYIIVHVL